jgi:Fur family ferric uptake transcriptional regulator
MGPQRLEKPVAAQHSAIVGAYQRCRQIVRPRPLPVPDDGHRGSSGLRRSVRIRAVHGHLAPSLVCSGRTPGRPTPTDRQARAGHRWAADAMEPAHWRDTRHVRDGPPKLDGMPADVQGPHGDGLFSFAPHGHAPLDPDPHSHVPEPQGHVSLSHEPRSQANRPAVRDAPSGAAKPRVRPGTAEPDAGDREDWQARLRDRGYRLTPQRQLVLEAVARLGHATPEAVVAEVRRTATAVNISTVYRTLDLLEDLGLVSHAHLTHGAPTYHAAGPDRHIHLVCGTCGSIDELPPDRLAGLVDDLRRELGFTVNVEHVALTGRCADCSAAARG